MFQDANISVTTSGNAHVVLGEATGWAHLVSRSWDITSFKAYELSLTLMQQLPHDPYLVTIGVSVVFVIYIFYACMKLASLSYISHVTYICFQQNLGNIHTWLSD